MLSEAYERERAREEEEEAAAARRAAEDAAEASRGMTLDRGGGMTSAERAWDYVADVAHASRARGGEGEGRRAGDVGVEKTRVVRVNVTLPRSPIVCIVSR